MPPNSKVKSANNLNLHRRFNDVASYVSELGGPKGRVIEKVLIANNGVAAVKAIRSIRRWAYDVFGNERAIKFVVMATPEDLKANAEYIRMADIVIDVPGGSNNHNYANVTLIVELARLHGVNAVWAGWGHASEKPALPNTLAKSDPPIKFIGPAGPPMHALGDKIGSTIIAQNAGVPCIAWNGSHVVAEYDVDKGSLPEEAFNDACVTSASDASKAAEKIGFPIMIKASEGGGGKGIRMVNSPEDVQNAYRQVCGEVPGSPIFIMKLSSKSRHLEVQVLADEYGNAIALNGRDCSVQRRHQKIIEEGPPVAASPEVWKKMEDAAVSLAKAVGYTNAGTVEYLYSEADEKFYFLELNPRLQVEHPVTEMITRVNLPAAQLQVAMGIPLYHIPEIRELYGKNRFEDDVSDGKSIIDFSTAERLPPYGHCIAVRITAENAEAGFKPTSGGIQELNFRSTPNVWGYFSMDSSGSIHEFADSQFGHLFASGMDREQARRNMVLALKELSIRGDISTTVDYISKLIELNDFIENNIDTGWLDGIIKSGGVSVQSNSGAAGTSTSSTRTSVLNNDMLAVIGATISAYDQCTADESTFLELLKRGQLPSLSLLNMVREVELILDGIKYKLRCTQVGSNLFMISLSSNPSKFVATSVRMLSDGGYLIAIEGMSHVAYQTSKPDVANGMRLNIGGKNIAFSPDYDPSSLRTDVAGKLVKKLVPNGAHVKKGTPYAEIEVMKMFMPLKVEESGVITWANNEGAALAAGDLLAKLELENPDNVSTATVFEGDLDVPGWGSSGTHYSAAQNVQNQRPHVTLRKAMDRLKGGIAGYAISPAVIDHVMKDIEKVVTDPTLPVYEIEEHLSVLNGRINGELYSNLSQMISDFKESCKDDHNDKSKLRFPADQIKHLIAVQTSSIRDESERAAFVALTTPLVDAADPYTKSRAVGVPGAERVLCGFLSLLREWIAVERCFCDGVSYADAVDQLRRANKDNVERVLQMCRSHSSLKYSASIILRIIDSIWAAGKTDISTISSSKIASVVLGADGLENTTPCLTDIATMSGNETYDALSERCRTVLIEESLPSIEERMSKVREAAVSLEQSLVQEVITNNVVGSDILFPLLKSSADSSSQIKILEVATRKQYRAYDLKEFIQLPDKSALKFTYSTKRRASVFSSGAKLTSVTDLSRCLSNSKLSDTPSRSNSESSLQSHEAEGAVPSNVPRFCLMKICDHMKDLQDGGDVLIKLFQEFPQYSGDAPRCATGPANALSVFILQAEAGLDQSSMAEKFELLLSRYMEDLEKADIRRVSFLIPKDADTTPNQYPLPSVFTFRETADFKEDHLYRDIEPEASYHLDMLRLTKNFSVTCLGSHLSPTGQIYLYKALPKPLALEQDKKANKSPRLFARAVSFVSDFSAGTFERLLVEAFNAIESIKTAVPPGDNHLFLNVAGDSQNTVIDPVDVEQVVISILKRHTERATRLGLAEIETKATCIVAHDSHPISLRLVASNPTGFVPVVHTYVEAVDGSGNKRVFKSIGGTKANLACSGDSSWENMLVTSPYPLTRPFDAQRKAAAKSSDTLYCYDLPALFEAAVEKQWADASSIAIGSRPLMVMYTVELVVKNKFGGPWTMQDYLNGNLELVETHRSAGKNDVGMVAWLMTLKTVEYPNGRQVVLVANDITHKAGSFGTREDVVFKMASEFAREKRIPRLYVAANSGARIGLAEGIKKVFKVAFKVPSNPESGVDFLYVSKSDYERLGVAQRALIGVPVTLNGEAVYKITDIIGSEPDLGVENLKGSGLIAGETSRAYDDVFTLTIVLGRTVGIGAYLVRLGQRTIQKTTSSPIILTGYQALNKLMGVDVYSTNDQLGGPAIMYSNGISHLAENNHLSAVISAVNWLSFVPSIRGGLLPVTDITGIDEIERPICFMPKAGVPYDPRYLLAGKEDEQGDWHGGFFDKGSFTETLAGWAKSVVVGRARLGGIPMGVIATENRTAEAIKPADPADLRASEAVIQEAGCVWFPNSAYKTAQAINDFRTEDLPIIIFANWRGFSGGQRDMFDEVLKYGSLIVDAFVKCEQPVFVYIPPHAEIRGGAWVVLDASINESVMEMYASAEHARGGVLEANGAATVKYRTKDILATMHRLDEKLIALDKELEERVCELEREEILTAIKEREQALLPVYEQISVQFCELHDTPGRMQAVGVIERSVEWKHARSFFYWRLRRKLAEFDLRKKIIETAQVGRGMEALSPVKASTLIKSWFLETQGASEALWNDDKAVLSWMAQKHDDLEMKIVQLTRENVVQEVFQVITAGGQTAVVGTSGIVEGISRAMATLSLEEQATLKDMLKSALQL
ncbi:hypothetical protein HJC23_012787 [Cyclotella cryptica]|uniref:Acetyl-CoA carboxylase n=1 Tax=Cyclotella cryptica TaxID=29204 RepID=A0ABD3Q411_9STRA|eukprot:CCRYP_009008-RA/>CCRYP_009008-RA protein AED:0.13 eAED:0.13 QI:224/1/1/1/1/1/5/164/2333